MSFQCLTTRSVNWLDHWIKSSLLEKCPLPARHPYSSTLIQIRLDQPLGWTRIKRAKSGGLKGCVTMELRSRFAVKYCKNKCHSSLILPFLHSSRERSQWGQTDALIEATQLISVWNFNGIMRGVTAAKIFFHTDKMGSLTAHGSERHLVTPIQGKPNVSLCSCINPFTSVGPYRATYRYYSG